MARKHLADLDVSPQPTPTMRTQSHPMHGACKVEGCGSRLDGDDHVCGYHRALRRGDVAGWRQSQGDWREGLYAQFRRDHEGDVWGSLCEASYDLQSPGDRQELLAELKRKMRDFGALPYDPREREAA